MSLEVGAVRKVDPRQDTVPDTTGLAVAVDDPKVTQLLLGDIVSARSRSE